MQTLSFKVGDMAYLHMGGRENPLRPGKVIAAFERLDQTLYVLEIDTHIEPTYEVRDGCQLSDSPDGPIGLWRDVLNKGE